MINLFDFNVCIKKYFLTHTVQFGMLISFYLLLKKKLIKVLLREYCLRTLFKAKDALFCNILCNDALKLKQKQLNLGFNPDNN